MDKFAKFFKLIEARGGVMGSLNRIYVMDDLKAGKHMGTDKYGNKYYENREYFFGRHRWVEYCEEVHINYDASQIPAEWFGWLHNTTDLTPDQDCNRPEYCWMQRHTEHGTGTSRQYVPYSTTVPKIHVWAPPGSKPPSNSKEGSSADKECRHEKEEEPTEPPKPVDPCLRNRDPCMKRE